MENEIKRLEKQIALMEDAIQICMVFGKPSEEEEKDLLYLKERLKKLQDGSK